MTSESQIDREYSFSHADFERVRKLIYGRAGISLNTTKQNMVYSRLSRRLRALNLGSFVEYLDSLEAGESAEWQEFVNALTTNLTSFFREAHHFPVLQERVASLGREPLRIWCAAASTGEEPYSIVMTALENLGQSPSFKLTASDIGYVNAHGTATLANDRAEAAATNAVFGAGAVPVSSTKGVTGHTLGAAGITEAIVVIQALEQQTLPPSANLRQLEPDLGLDALTQPRSARLRHAMSNNFGFGGSNCSLIFGRAD